LPKLFYDISNIPHHLTLITVQPATHNLSMSCLVSHVQAVIIFHCVCQWKTVYLPPLHTCTHIRILKSFVYCSYIILHLD